MADTCNFCGRSHGWKTLVGSNTGLLICDDCVQLAVLVLERQSIEQRMEGLRNVMKDAIAFEEQKGIIDALTSEVSRLSEVLDTFEVEPDPGLPEVIERAPEAIDDPHFGELDGD